MEVFLNQTKYDSHGFRPEKPQFLDFRNGGGGNVSSVEFKQPLFNNPYILSNYFSLSGIWLSKNKNRAIRFQKCKFYDAFQTCFCNI